MISLKFTHPLQWPDRYMRTPKWEKSVNTSFKAGLTMEEALMFLNDELTAINPKSATLNTDYENLHNPRSMRKVGNDVAVVLRIGFDTMQCDVACDRWIQVEHNIYALHLALRNMRSIVDWGVGNYTQLLGGFAPGVQAAGYAAPAAGANDSGESGGAPALEEWRMLLGLGPTATIDDAHAVYRRRAKTVADNQDELTKLNLAMDEASKALGG